MSDLYLLVIHIVINDHVVWRSISPMPTQLFDWFVTYRLGPKTKCIVACPFCELLLFSNLPLFHHIKPSSLCAADVLNSKAKWEELCGDGGQRSMASSLTFNDIMSAIKWGMTLFLPGGFGNHFPCFFDCVRLMSVFLSQKPPSILRIYSSVPRLSHSPELSHQHTATHLAHPLCQIQWQHLPPLQNEKETAHILGVSPLQPQTPLTTQNLSLLSHTYSSLI